MLRLAEWWYFLFVIDGPFKNMLIMVDTEKISKDGCLFLDILEYVIEEK